MIDGIHRGENGPGALRMKLDAGSEVARLSQSLREDVHTRLRRRGAVLGLSGGVDSAVVAALCVHALGKDKVLAVLMPERESSPESVELAANWAQRLGIEAVVEDITSALEGSGCYRRRDAAIQRVFPAYGAGWRSKITLPGSLLEDETLNVFSLTVVSPEGEQQTRRVLSNDYFQIVAASNLKQRMRMAMLYYYAELRNFAVIGTANRNEHDLGFFVKYGDGGVDLSPIVHLFKSQVYTLAEYLDVPSEIRSRPPTSDTYSAGSTQEEFFFRLPFETLDSIWAGWEAGVPIKDLAAELRLEDHQIQRVIDDLIRKQRTTQYLRSAPLTYAAH